MSVVHAIVIALMSAFALANDVKLNPLSDDFIKMINSKQNTWKAGRNFPLGTSFTYIKTLMGTLKIKFIELPKVNHEAELIAILPNSFDPRNKWPNCPSLNEIRDQGSCSSSWALSAVEAMTDRYCIFSNGTQHFHFSAEDLISCCEICGLGCIRGIHTAAWEYWKNVGLVSGGNYKSNEGCKPYMIPPGESYITGDFPLYRRTVDISQCLTSCSSNYSIEYHKDKHHGKNVYTIDRNEDQIKAELFKNGPVEGVITVYTDFLHYKDGVYIHRKGRYVGDHSVKILGWGVENGLKYWLVANCWNQHWGNNGFFKILRGTNHCDIESSIVAGEPLIL